MSTAFYPQGMRPSNGFALPQGGYKTWKGSGVFSNPVASSAIHVRPLTNKDPGNVFPGPFGKPRPMKHYRRGFAPVYVSEAEWARKHGAPYAFADAPADAPGQEAERAQIAYNVMRGVKSSVQDNGIATQMERAGEVTTDQWAAATGAKSVTSWFPIASLTEKPQGGPLCCNAQRNALRRVQGASTILKKNYAQTTEQYLRRKCWLYRQREFNFARRGGAREDEFMVGQCDALPVFVGVEMLQHVRPLVAASEWDRFVARLSEEEDPAAVFRAFGLDVTLLSSLQDAAGQQAGVQNVLAEKACRRVYYKPNNRQFAQQGAVASGLRTFKRDVTTIATSIARTIGAQRAAAVDQADPSVVIPMLYKNKAPLSTCPPPRDGSFFFVQPAQKRSCVR